MPSTQKCYKPNQEEKARDGELKTQKKATALNCDSKILIFLGFLINVLTVYDFFYNLPA
jgi:hypothetical protein